MKLSFQQNSRVEFSFYCLTWYNFNSQLSFNFTLIAWEAAVQEASDKTFLLVILSCLYSLVPKFLYSIKTTLAYTEVPDEEFSQIVELINTKTKQIFTHYHPWCTEDVQ